MIISGKIYWAKILGAPQPTKYSPGEWSFDLSVDKGTREKMVKAGVKQSYFKNKDDEKGTFLQFKRAGKKKDGESAKPFTVIDAQKKEWDDSTLIGNGSEVNVRIALNEREYNNEKFLKPSAIAIQVWKLEEYKGGDEFPEASPEAISEGEEW